MTPALLLRIFLPFAAGYFLSFLFRVVNAVLAPHLLHDLGMGASTLGLLTATYFIAFASAQLPLGVLLDRYGPRRVEALLLLIAAGGAFCFARAESVPLLIVGRALIGLGVSACLMAAFKAFTQWFSPDKLPLINGLQMAAGGLGALAATSPVQWMLTWSNWRGVFIGLALFTMMVSALVFLVVPAQENKGAEESLARQMRGISEVFTSPLFWRVAPLTALSQGTFYAIQGLWAGPWLKAVDRLAPQAVVDGLFSLAVAMVAGFIVLGSLGGRLQRWGVSVRTSAVAGMSLFIVIQAALLLGPQSWHGVLWLLFGFFGTSGILTYATLSQDFSPRLSGRVNTALNLLVFVAAFIGQWLIGIVAGCWPEPEPGRLAAIGLHLGFAVLLVAQVAALLWSLSTRPGRQEG